MTMTIEVPETVYEKLSVLPESGRSQYIALSKEARGIEIQNELAPNQ